jgi:hypothetical protein
MKKFSVKNVGWYLADKLIVPTTTLIGVGAARALDDGSLLERIVHTVKFPYDLLVGKGFIPEIARTFIDLADNVIEHPVETLGAIGGGYLAGRIAKWYVESKRMKKIYTPEVKA